MTTTINSLIKYIIKVWVEGSGVGGTVSILESEVMWIVDVVWFCRLSGDCRLWKTSRQLNTYAIIMELVSITSIPPKTKSQVAGPHTHTSCLANGLPQQDH